MLIIQALAYYVLKKAVQIKENKPSDFDKWLTNPFLKTNYFYRI